MLQKIIQIGNSAGITISKDHLKALGVTIGDEIEASIDTNTQQLLLDLPKKRQSKSKNSKISQEFQLWLNNFIEEDKELLEELANR